MANEQNKQQGQQDQPQYNQHGQQNPGGSDYTTDKSKTNPSHGSGLDPKNLQDISKKDPSRQQGSTDRPDQEESDQGNKRRAS